MRVFFSPELVMRRLPVGRPCGFPELVVPWCRRGRARQYRPAGSFGLDVPTAARGRAVRPKREAAAPARIAERPCEPLAPLRNRPAATEGCEALRALEWDPARLLGRERGGAAVAPKPLLEGGGRPGPRVEQRLERLCVLLSRHSARRRQCGGQDVVLRILDGRRRAAPREVREPVRGTNFRWLLSSAGWP